VIKETGSQGGEIPSHKMSCNLQEAHIMSAIEPLIFCALELAFCDFYDGLSEV